LNLDSSANLRSSEYCIVVSIIVMCVCGKHDGFHTQVVVFRTDIRGVECGGEYDQRPLPYAADGMGLPGLAIKSPRIAQPRLIKAWLAAICEV
jgi:hypothetical protein